jgi:flagellar biosynthesis protein
MTDNDHIADIRERDGREKPPAAISKAVAIEYEKGSDQAPIVTASGKGAIAEQILAIAFERGIKVRQDAELVDILSMVDVDSPIPLEAFTAVAEILAFVYKANDAKKPRQAQHQEPR